MSRLDRFCFYQIWRVKEGKGVPRSFAKREPIKLGEFRVLCSPQTQYDTHLGPSVVESWYRALFGDIVEWLARLTDTQVIQVRVLVSPLKKIYKKVGVLSERRYIYKGVKSNTFNATNVYIRSFNKPKFR